MWDFIESEKENLAVGLGIQIFMGSWGLHAGHRGVGVAKSCYVG